MGTDRLGALFEEARRDRRTALLPYLTAGLPDPDGCLALFEAMAEAGADGFEVGIPYSDPLMDGPVIRRAADRVLSAGMTVGGALDLTAEVAELTGRPVLVMTYANPVLRLGPEVFFEHTAEAGACGVIVADLPVDEAEPFLAAARRAGVGLALFVAPTSGEDRIRKVAAAEPVFIYGVANLGVTGEREGIGRTVPDLVARVRALTDLPLVLGVGISTPSQTGALAGSVEGIIVGSALVRRILEASDLSEADRQVRSLVRELKERLG